MKKIKFLIYIGIFLGFISIFLNSCSDKQNDYVSIHSVSTSTSIPIHHTLPNINKVDSVPVFDSLVKVLDSSYFSNCVLYFHIKWYKYVSGNVVYIYDTVASRGNPCVPLIPSTIVASKVFDSCYIKYCIFYCEHTWQAYIGEIIDGHIYPPNRTFDTIIIGNQPPCLPKVLQDHPPEY